MDKFPEFVCLAGRSVIFCTDKVTVFSGIQCFMPPAFMREVLVFQDFEVWAWREVWTGASPPVWTKSGERKFPKAVGQAWHT